MIRSLPMTIDEIGETCCARPLDLSHRVDAQRLQRHPPPLLAVGVDAVLGDRDHRYGLAR
jgi:hypothetical protein